MKKIRKWFFKLLTGYDLVEYEDVLKEWQTTLDSAKRIAEINDSLIKHSGEVVDLLNSYLNEEEK
jgi:hypothetical protein|nr:MAG TPA: hypothetical protein [Bacteriophage sp.]